MAGPILGYTRSRVPSRFLALENAKMSRTNCETLKLFPAQPRPVTLLATSKQENRVESGEREVKQKSKKTANLHTFKLIKCLMLQPNGCACAKLSGINKSAQQPPKCRVNFFLVKGKSQVLKKSASKKKAKRKR